MWLLSAGLSLKLSMLLSNILSYVSLCIYKNKLKCGNRFFSLVVWYWTGNVYDCKRTHGGTLRATPWPLFQASFSANFRFISYLASWTENPTDFLFIASRCFYLIQLCNGSSFHNYINHLWNRFSILISIEVRNNTSSTRLYSPNQLVSQ